MAPAGTARRDSKCRTNSCCCRCRRIRPSSTRWKMSGSSYAETGSAIAYGKPTKPFSMLAKTLGILDGGDAMAVVITRLDLSAADLREAAAGMRDAKAARRMLAIALV